MKYPLLIIIGILILIICFLIAKTRVLRKTIKEINNAFQDRLTADTNLLIDISSRDPYALKLASDINEQLKLLREERHKFRQGDRELKDAITNLSHDLRTPLTAINGYLDLLEQEEKSEAVKRYLDCIRNRTQALTSLTEELFRYSVISSIETLKIERINLVKVLEENLVSFYGAMKERGIEPDIKLPEEPVWRDLDVGALNRIFSNIISNALKYSDGDLSVVMTEDATITFTNTAINLDAVTAGRLFDRFYTVESARNSTGLGLAIAKALVERSGGSIKASYQNRKLNITINF